MSRLQTDSETIEVRSSSVHGLGVFARVKLRRNEVVGIYEGRRHKGDPTPRPDGLTYLFSLSDGGFIDGGEGGNATRHINHSCEPNCWAQEFWGADGLGVMIKARRAIKEGAELFLDYDLAVDPNEDLARYACYCAALTCRGSMVTPDAQ